MDFEAVVAMVGIVGFKHIPPIIRLVLDILVMSCEIGNKQAFIDALRVLRGTSTGLYKAVENKAEDVPKENLSLLTPVSVKGQATLEIQSIGPELRKLIIHACSVYLEPKSVQEPSEKQWVAYYRDAPEEVVLVASPQTMLAFLRLRYISRQVPFNNSKWGMIYRSEKVFQDCGTQLTTGRDSSSLALFEQTITSGFALLASKLGEDVSEIFEC